MKRAWGLLAAVCVLVIGVYAYLSQSGSLELLNLNPADAYYNLLVRGFRAGQLGVAKEVPPGFRQLADPYDPKANAPYWGEPYRMLDLSYYNGRLYLYFGVTPALLLFWPYVVLTGHYLFHRQAVLIFCATGFLVSVGLLRALWRRYFAEVSAWVVAACAVALGLATIVPVMLSLSDVYEVPISCGYMLTTLALAAIWCALHEPERRWRWSLVASVAYGLAVGARPDLLFGAVILLVPVAQAWRERGKILAPLLGAMGPIIFIGLGLMLYNARRFGSPFEFGWHYQVTAARQVGRHSLSLSYLWFNFRVYFLEPVRWSVRFPFVHGIAVPPIPAGYSQVKNPFGVLTNIPLVWLALAAPLAWRNRSGQASTSESRQARSRLRWFVTAVALLFGLCALTVGLFWSANFRYEVGFLPALMMLAVVGILGLERALADHPARRRVARWGWGVLLGFSVAFNLLASVEYHAEAHNLWGLEFVRRGEMAKAVEEFEWALRIEPDYAEAHMGLGLALGSLGRTQEAIGQFEEAVRIKPGLADAHNNLGAAYMRVGKLTEAMGCFERALRVKPDYVDAHNNLAVALARVGRLEEAAGHWEQALRIYPQFAGAHYNLGVALEGMGKTNEAIGHYRQALRIEPNLGGAREALARLGAGGE